MRRALLAVVILAFALRVGYALKTGALLHPKTWEQEEIATNLLERHQFLFANHFIYRSYTEPMYPFLAAAVYAVTKHSRTALVIVQIVIATATICMTAVAARVATKDEAVALTAATMAALHPGLVHYASILHPFVLDCFFFVAAATAILRYRDDASARNGAIAALAIGAGALTRPTILVFLLPLVWVGPRCAKRVTFLVALSLAVVAPWTVRNAVVHHRFMLTRSGTGFVFWLGNNPASTGSPIDTDGRIVEKMAPPELREKLDATHDELERDRLYSDAAWSFIMSHPLEALWRFVERLYYFWWFSPQWAIGYGAAAKLAYRAWWIAMLILMAAGAFAARQQPARGGLLLLATLAVMISVVQAAFYVEGRHRLAIEPLLMPIAAFGFMSIVAHFSTRRASLRPVS